jgi:hypothetical protein
VATPEYKPAVPTPNPAISPTYSGLPILRRAAVLQCWLSFEGQKRTINTKKGLWSTKNNSQKKGRKKICRSALTQFSKIKFTKLVIPFQQFEIKKKSSIKSDILFNTSVKLG